MSKTLWNTIKIEVPNEMVNITKNDKVTVKKSLTKTTTYNKRTDEQIIVNEWDTPHNYIILQQYDEKAYENIENTILKENKLNHHIFTPDLLAFTKKYNDDIVKTYSTKENYKIGMDALYKGLYNIIEDVIDSNNLNMKPGSPVDVFKDKNDYNLGLKRLSKHLATKIYAQNSTLNMKV